MFNLPPPLKKGDLIEIVSPAKAIDKDLLDFAQNFLESEGFSVKISEHAAGSYHYFSGTISDRLHDFQQAIDGDASAILCARGGYGSVQLVDKLDWTTFHQKPKWIIGFSDITVFHQRLACERTGSIHATMPLNFQHNTKEALNTLHLSLTQGYQPKISAASTKHNKTGTCEGNLIGGNASILYSMLGTNDHPDYTDSILFIEDLAEQIYHIDRIFFAFKKAGVLDRINGLIIGGMTDMKDTQVPFGKELEEVIIDHLHGRNIPIAFNFPAGHVDDNRALVLGDRVSLRVTEHTSELKSTRER